MTAPHPYVAIRSCDQWRRVAHFDTALTVSKDGIVLAEREFDASESEFGIPKSPAFLFFDPFCRLLRLTPENGQVSIWRDISGSSAPEELAVFESLAPALGDFSWVSNPDGPFYKPGGICVDSAGHLFISESGVNRIWIFDMVDKRLIRSIPLPDSSHPGDSDVDGLDVYITSKNGLGKVTSSSEFRYMIGDLAGHVFDRVAVMNGVICVLENAGTAHAKVIPWDYPDQFYAAPFASDIVFSAPDRLIIAFRPGELFEEHIIVENAGTWNRTKDRTFRAKAYDGRGIVRTPEGRVGYFSEKGFRYALPVKPRYKTRGRVITFALDSGVYHNQWGLTFIDACIPKGCGLRVRLYTNDELAENFLLTRTQASNDTEFGELFAPERSPSMPKDTAFTTFSEARFDDADKLYRRGNDDELIWDEYVEDGRLVTYETPVNTNPGRYLWIAIELTGNGLDTPYIRALRVQKSGHQLLKHLPSLYAREPKVESFLRRYLALPEAILSEFDVSAIMRHVLLDPRSCREEWLSWLAGFVGLIFDERFNPDTRRQLIAEAIWLFRFRGTTQGLERFIQIYANNQLGFNTVIQIVEKFKFRGHASMAGTESDDMRTGAVLGVDYRIGSGETGNDEIGIRDIVGEDSYAHRFIVLIAASMGTEEMEVVNHIIAVHRPAHTAFEVCTIDAGMRVGRGLYLQLNSFVGQSAGFVPMQLASGTLGRNGILGIAKTASTTSGGQVGIDARMG